LPSRVCFTPRLTRRGSSALACTLPHDRTKVTSLAVALTFPGVPHSRADPQSACLVIGGLVFVGERAKGMRVMQPLRELGNTLADISQPMPFTVVQTPSTGSSRWGSSRATGRRAPSQPRTSHRVIASGPISGRPHCTLVARPSRWAAPSTVLDQTETPTPSGRVVDVSVDGNWGNPSDNACQRGLGARKLQADLRRSRTVSRIRAFTGQADETASAPSRTRLWRQHVASAAHQGRVRPGQTLFRLE
jgi:hypothetical protein